MLVHQFPDLQWLKRQANTSFADRRAINGLPLPVGGWPNVILHASSRKTVRDGIKGPLSIFTNQSGRSQLTVGAKRVSLTPDVFFISNSGQYYTLEIDERTPTETSNIHFGEKFSEDALRTIAISPESLLEGKTGDSRDFYNRVVPITPEFKRIVQSLLTPGNTQLQEDQGLFQLLELLAQDQTQLEKMKAKIAAVKPSTKEEVMKRLLQATDFLHTAYHQSPDLDELARISCLSKFHFLRLFKIAHGQTPHQFLVSIRITRAKELLRNTSDDVKTIADTIGFESSSSFSRQFRSHTGVYPTQYRA